MIDYSRSFFDNAKSTDEFDRHLFSADRKVVDRPLGLSAPVFIIRDFDRTHAVGLNARLLGH